jgi:hypothetical protein
LCIADLLSDGSREPSPLDILAAVGRTGVLDTVGVYRQAAKQRLLAVVALFFRLFVPAPDWQFVDGEVSVPGASLDLVWRDSAGRILADELKTGEGAATDYRRAVDEQVARQVSGGHKHYGDDFVGVRVLFLAAPSRSFLARADGSRESLAEATL